MPADWIRDLKEHKSKKEKKLIIERALIAYRLGSESAENFLYTCYLAYNPMYCYNLENDDVIKTKNIYNQANPWTKFWGVVEMLRTHSLEKSKLLMIINIETASLFNSLEWNTVCRPVLLKDLRCGIDVKMLNCVLGNSEWRIPELE